MNFRSSLLNLVYFLLCITGNVGDKLVEVKFNYCQIKANSPANKRLQEQCTKKNVELNKEFLILEKITYSINGYGYACEIKGQLTTSIRQRRILTENTWNS